MEGGRWIPIFMGMTEGSNEIATGSTQVILCTPLAMTDELKLTIFTYKWGGNV